VLGQTKVDAKSNEIAAIPVLLKKLEAQNMSLIRKLSFNTLKQFPLKKVLT